MKNLKKSLFIIFSISLATITATSLELSVTDSWAVAQTSDSSSSKGSTDKQEKSTENTIESMITTYTTPISIILSAIGGLVTYSINESWKRHQYLEEKIKEFENKPETINVRKMLGAELQCVELFPFLEKPTHRYVIVEDALWAEALLECKCNHTLKEQYNLIDKDSEFFYKQLPALKSCIRDNFNRYLNHLQHFEKMIESKVIDQNRLRVHLDPWFDLIDHLNDESDIECPASSKKYIPKKALLEYMGLLEEVPLEKLSNTQKDVRNLVTRFRSLSSFQPKRAEENNKESFKSAFS